MTRAPGPLAYVQSALLLTFADEPARYQQILDLPSLEAVTRFCECLHVVYIVD